jgi:phosphoglycolate phosphatase-like HAD superfamily hydrolase
MWSYSQESKHTQAAWLSAIHYWRTSMPTTAVLWIRDGVLIDRMAVNAVSFAVASLSYANANVLAETNLTALVNFAFQESGISCADKMHKYNEERFPLVADVAAAAGYYTELAGDAAKYCSYFNGACELIEHLKSRGVLNFISSAVEQTVLDAWAQSEQAKPLVGHLTEILGKRSEGFNKGRDHFAHVQSRYEVNRIIYVADAVAEITTGARYAQEFNISTVGFAHVITNEKIREAHKRVLQSHSMLSEGKAPRSIDDPALDGSCLFLPDEKALLKNLQDAKATYVVSGDASTIMSRLSKHLDSCGVLPQQEVSNG